MKPTFTVRLPKPLIDAIKARAAEDGISQGKLLTKLLTPTLAPVERAADSPVHPPASPTSLPPEDASPTVEVDRESSDALSATINKLAQTMPRSTAERVARQMVRNA